jgi:S-formylglutathione hydrolase FrmB
MYVGVLNAQFMTLAGVDLGIDLDSIVKELMSTGQMGEAIIILPDAINSYGGSQYGRTEVLGDYRDYIARDLVEYIDSKYRTIPDREHRGLTGHSMGATGAISLAMEYPDVFGSVASLSPNYPDVQSRIERFVMPNTQESLANPTIVSPDTVDEDVWEIFTKTLTANVSYAMAAAFSPNPDNPPYYVDLPVKFVDGEAVVDEEVMTKWKEGDLISEIERNGANLANTSLLVTEGVGEVTIMAEGPGFPLILAALNAQGISYVYAPFPGDHLSHMRSQLASGFSFLSPHIGATPIEDFSKVFFMTLTPGLNMISLPLKPVTKYTARSFAEEIGATVVIKLDESPQRFVGFTLDAPDDGFDVEGGKGYIVNMPESKVVAFTGTAWTNQPPVEEAAPSLAGSNGAWAFVISGRLLDDSDNTLKKDGYLVTVRNTRTNAVATDVVRSRYFAAAFADLARRNVVEIGDKLEVVVKDQSGEIASETIPYTVTAETIRQAFLPITLKDVGKPHRSLLLQNYPNPFNPETWIPYQLREPAEVVIRIYDATGRLVRTLDLGHRKAGYHLSRTRAAYWNGHNDAGEKVASNIYFYQLRAGDFSATRRMLIVK